MGKCILAGHPPVGGQIGYGTYTGNGAASRTISLGITPKWVLVSARGAISSSDVGSTNSRSISSYSGLALDGFPALSGPNAGLSYTNPKTVEITNNGFNVFYSIQSLQYTNWSAEVYHYIYGT